MGQNYEIMKIRTAMTSSTTGNNPNQLKNPLKSTLKVTRKRSSRSEGGVGLCQKMIRIGEVAESFVVFFLLAVVCFSTILWLRSYLGGFSWLEICDL